MNPLTRRDFLRSSAIGAGALLTTAAGVRSEEVPANQPSAADRVKLGKTGLVASRLAQGTGVHGGNQQSDHTRMGQEDFTRIIRHGFDRGLNFWDMADLYGTHTFMRNAMKGIDRDKYVVLSKVWTRPEKWNNPAGGATAAVERFCKELNTDVIDICLVHCMIEKDWTDREKRARDELSELKQQGKVLAVGCSCHSHDALKAAATHPWVDVIEGAQRYGLTTRTPA